MTNCPTPATLSRLVDGTLSDEVIADLRVHLQDCALCRALLDEETEDPELGRWLGQAPHNSPFSGEAALAGLVERMSHVPCDETGADAPVAIVGLGPPLRAGDLGSLGGYRVLAELGRGGLGIVFHGYDETLARPVAIKLLQAESVEGDSRRRLRREAQLASRLHHEHVVVVHAVDETADGLPFIVMELVAGENLAHRLRTRTRLDPREAAELAAQVADGLGAAHAAGLVHRDIKPANILLDAATGRPRIADFGLAHAAGVTGSVSTGAAFGTPSYMSPEQARGDESVDPASDQYSLGATLYETLTGEPPFRGTPARIVHQILTEEPAPPRRLNEGIPRELETICLKTLSKDPRQRYATAAALADDLRRWLRGEPILARPVGPAGHAARWARRNRRVAALAATSFLLLLALAVGAVVAAIRIEGARGLAVAEQHRADRNARTATAAAERAAEHARVASAQRTLALDTVSVLIKEVQDHLGQAAGTLALRRRLADAASARLEKIANDPSGDTDVRLARALAHERLGELSFLAGRTAEARTHFTAARDQAAALGEAPAEERTEADRLQALALDRLGDLALFAQEPAAAETAYRRALALRAAMPAAERDSPEGLRSRAVSENKLGDIALQTARWNDAQAAFERGLELTKRDNDPDPQRHRFDLRFVHSRLGDVALARRDFEGAERAYRKARTYAEEQFAAAPDDPKARREVAVCDSKLGGAALRRADPKAALAYYRKYLEASDALAAASPSNAEAHRDALTARSLTADALAAAGDVVAADRMYLETLQQAEALSDADGTSAQKRTDVFLILNKLIDLSMRRERFDEAADRASQARARLRALADGRQITPALQKEYDAQYAAQQAACLAGKRALAEPEWIETQSADLIPRLWAIRALTLARRGECDAADRAAEALHRIAPSNALALFVVARAYALCVRSAATDSERNRYVAKAIGALREAARREPNVLDGTGYEPDLDPLYHVPEYQKLTRGE